MFYVLVAQWYCHMQWYQKHVKATCIEYCGLTMPAWGEGTHTNPQKSIFWKVLHNKKSLEQFFFVLSFISSCQLLPDPSLAQMKEKSIDSKKLEKHADRPKFPNKKTFPQNPNILCDFFVQFNCRIEFCNILCRRAWLYIYILICTTGIINILICLLYCTSSRSMGQFMQKLQKRQLHQMFATSLGCDTVDWSTCVRYLGSMCKILYTQVRCFIADCRNGAIDRSFYIPIPQFLRLFRWIGYIVLLLMEEILHHLIGI